MLVTWVEYAAIFATTAALSTVLTYFFRTIALKYQILDAPDLDRKLQKHPIPYLGGIAISGTFVLFVGAVYLLNPTDKETTLSLYGILTPAFLLSVIGLIDDVKGLTKKTRVLVQSVAAFLTAFVLSASGTGSELTSNLFVNNLLVIVWVIFITNAINLVDNMDGHASVVGGSAAISFFLIAIYNGQYLVAAFSIALAGAIFGFWFWNRNPAKIYMGDSGSLFIGFLLAAISIRIDLAEEPKEVAMIAPVVVLLFLILDTSLVVVSRIKRGGSPFEGGRDHVSHRLAATGLTNKQINLVAATFSLFNLVIAFISIFLSEISFTIYAIALFTYGIVYIHLLAKDKEIYEKH